MLGRNLISSALRTALVPRAGGEKRGVSSTPFPSAGPLRGGGAKDIHYIIQPFCDLKQKYFSAKVGGLKISSANRYLQICGLFARFAHLPQMWLFADLRFAD
jgi:hypothetical protein